MKSDDSLETIFSIASKLLTEKDSDKVLSLLTDLGRDIINADRCTLWLVDHNNGEKKLWSKVGHNFSKVTMPFESGIVGHSVVNKKPIIIDDAYQHPNFNKEIDLQTNYRTKAIIVIPLLNKEEEVIGAYQAINSKSDNECFNENDLTKLSLVASFAGQTVETMLLNIEIEQTLKEMIYILGEVGEKRSNETANHVKRVAEYSYLLAKLANISDEEANVIKIASPLHDIGKIGIPDAILTKPAALTDEEYEKMKEHTSIGHEILKHSDRRILKAASIISLQHHEKWDGTGYPNQLKGEEIHPYARITALADVFDALSSKRVYKPSWSLEKVTSFMEEQSGVHFDPELVYLFLKNREKFIEIRNKYE
jgi:response regulator RpfG family c-di-GMP phosphodiesterase